jgi:hypothetical protein
MRSCSREPLSSPASTTCEIHHYTPSKAKMYMTIQKHRLRTVAHLVFGHGLNLVLRASNALRAWNIILVENFSGGKCGRGGKNDWLPHSNEIANHSICVWVPTTIRSLWLVADICSNFLRQNFMQLT